MGVLNMFKGNAVCFLLTARVVRVVWALLFLIQCFSTIAVADRIEQDDVVLMRGRCFTPSESARVLHGFSALHPDRAAWEERRNLIRRGILEGAGLDKLPAERKSPRIIRRAKIEMDGYTIENVAIETVEGFWLGGNLYLPKTYNTNNEELIPGILCPHGHWPNGRLAEFMQARCGAFARMGCAVFAYDILGEGDKTQVPHKHPLSLRLHHFNSIRALDFLCSLPNIDQDRLAVTGASGGGTQTFVLAAIDERLDLSMPVCQVSAHFYGGCVCESGLPVHVRSTHETNNVEIAASFAPKPQLLISNGEDWTAHTPLIEFPYVQRVYSHYDAIEQVANVHLPHEGHDYGPQKRAAAYRFLAKHFKLSLKPVSDDNGDVTEIWFRPLPGDALLVFNDQNPRPKNAIADPETVFERLDAFLGFDAKR